MINHTKKYVGVGDFQATPKIHKYILDVLQSGRLSYGPYISRFEKEFVRHHGASFGIMSNSGTSSLQIALQTLKIHYEWEDGDEVIVPATTFVATANIVFHNNMKPVFVDIEQNYYGINPKHIEDKITDRTRCIIPVHLFGMPCQMDEIMDIATKYGLKVIEDSCETMFADFKGKSVGSFGDIACFSTYIAHILITGVGGISITSNPEYAVTMRSLVNHGRDSIYLNIDDSKDISAEKMKEVIERRFLFVHPGHSFRVTELEGALGLAQLEEWETNIGQRRANADYLTRHLSEFSEHLQLPKIREGATHSFMMYPIVLKKEPKQKICNHLENMGVETRDMCPLINQPFYKQLINENDYPISLNIIERGFYIGCHPYITPELLDHIIETFKAYYQEKLPARPKTVALAIMTSSDMELSQKIFSEIDLSVFNTVRIFDFYPQEKIGNIFKEMKYEVLDVPDKSVLKVYKNVMETVHDDHIIFFSLNGSQDTQQLSAIISHLKLGYDMVIASRFLQEGKRYDADYFIPLRGIGNRLITLMLNFAFDSNLSDSYQPFRGVSSEFLCATGLDSEMLLNYQMSIRAVNMKKKIFEIPYVEKKSVSRISFMKACWIGFRTIPFIIREKVIQWKQNY